jgi:hypothetical protein
MTLRALGQLSRGAGRQPLARWRDPAQTARRAVAAGRCRKMVRAPSPRARPSMVIVSCAYRQQDMPASVASVLIDRLAGGTGLPRRSRSRRRCCCQVTAAASSGSRVENEAGSAAAAGTGHAP